MPTPANPDRVSLARHRELIAEHRRITKKIGPDLDTLKQIEATLKHTMGDALIGTINGKPVVEWSRGSRSRLDSAAMKLEAPEIYRKYLTTSTVRTFKVLPIDG